MTCNPRIVIFDDYQSRFTKDITHQRRAGDKTATIVTFTEDMKLSHEERPLLVKFKQHRNTLNSSLQKVNRQTRHSQADADLLIDQIAVESARRVDTLLVRDDTDLLIYCAITQKQTPINCFSSLSQVLKEILGEEMCNIILVIHAILRCDTKGGSVGPVKLGHLP